MKTVKIIFEGKEINVPRATLLYLVNNSADYSGLRDKIIGLLRDDPVENKKYQFLATLINKVDRQTWDTAYDLLLPKKVDSVEEKKNKLLATLMDKQT